MKLQLGLWFAILSAPSIGAATIDVSADTSATVRTGDTLVFHLLTSNFALDAARFGLPLYPSEVSFALVSAPLGANGEFAATLESADRGVSVAFGDLTFGPGYFQGSGYTGDVSTLQGRLSLSPLQSEVLFGSTSAVIALRNQGPDVEVGLAPYALRQSLYASLTGGPLSVGAVAGFGGPGRPHKSGSGKFLRSDEFCGRYTGPGTPIRGAIFVGRGTTVRDFGDFAAHFPKGGITTRKINCLHPLIHSVTIYMADRNPPLEVPQIHNGVTKSTE